MASSLAPTSPAVQRLSRKPIADKTRQRNADEEMRDEPDSQSSITVQWATRFVWWRTRSGCETESERVGSGRRFVTGGAHAIVLGTTHDRDIIAARNVLAAGLAVSAHGEAVSPVLL